MEAFARAEKKKRPNPELLFSDVYDQMPPRIHKQMEDMKSHCTQYKEYYPLDSHEPMTWCTMCEPEHWISCHQHKESTGTEYMNEIQSNLY